jgi:hypothetical protein
VPPIGLHVPPSLPLVVLPLPFWNVFGEVHSAKLHSTFGSWQDPSGAQGRAKAEEEAVKAEGPNSRFKLATASFVPRFLIGTRQRYQITHIYCGCGGLLWRQWAKGVNLLISS